MLLGRGSSWGPHGGLGREAGSWDWEADGQRWRITPRSPGVEPQTPGKVQQSRKAGFRFSFSSLTSSQEVWGRGETLSPGLNAREGEEGRQQPPVLELSLSRPRASWGAPGGVCPALMSGGRAERAGRHGGTDPVQCPGHAAVFRAALAGWSLASDRGEEGANVLAARAAQHLALFGDCSHPQVQARQRLQMVSAPRGREGAEFPGTVPYVTHRQPKNRSPRSPLTLYSDSDPLCPLR